MPPFESCAQPQCQLREEGVDSRSLAELIVNVLAGEKVTVEAPIRRCERCVVCVQQILEGGKPLPTVEDVERALVEGRRAYRRSRRGVRREAHRIE